APRFDRRSRLETLGDLRSGEGHGQETVPQRGPQRGRCALRGTGDGPLLRAVRGPCGPPPPGEIPRASEPPAPLARPRPPSSAGPAPPVAHRGPRRPPALAPAPLPPRRIVRSGGGNPRQRAGLLYGPCEPGRRRWPAG